MTKIAIAIWDGVEELDFAGPYEVLTAWGADVETVAEAREPIRCAHGLQVVPDTSWAELDVADVVLLPGGNTGPQPPV